ncbi:hypothetical protein WOC76_07055 [Methylocystis sp. IM3]|uniref:hypothetical protein n=1 Tax=unclassified Methylocystis TaxID=2625913 RepID=UPI0030FCB7E7
MYTFRNITFSALVSIPFVMALTPSANACGFFGCIANQIVPGSGDVGDAVNDSLGRPVDHVVNYGAGVVTGVITENPAAGAAVTEGLETYDQMRRGE